MNMKRARFWRNLLLFSALSGAASQPKAQAQEGVSRVGPGASSLTSEAPGAAGLPSPEGFAPLTPSPYMPLDPGVTSIVGQSSSGKTAIGFRIAAKWAN